MSTKRPLIKISMGASSIILIAVQMLRVQRTRWGWTGTQSKESSNCPRASKPTNSRAAVSRRSRANQVTHTASTIPVLSAIRAHTTQTQLTSKPQLPQTSYQNHLTTVPKWLTQSTPTLSQHSTPPPCTHHPCSHPEALTLAQPTKSMKQYSVSQRWNSEERASSCWYFQATRVLSACTRIYFNSVKLLKNHWICCCIIGLLNEGYSYKLRRKMRQGMSHMECECDIICLF